MRRVLVADDSKVVRDALEAALEPYGFDVHHADNGAAALQKLKTSPFDAVFVDIHMPVLDGPSLVRMMRAHGIPAKAILITSGASTPVVASVVKLGVSEYVSKPFNPQRIRVVLARVMGLPPDEPQVCSGRLLLQHPDEAMADRARELLPSHVEVDAAAAFTRVLELAERRHYGVVLDTRVLDGESSTAAGLIRASLPILPCSCSATTRRSRTGGRRRARSTAGCRASSTKLSSAGFSTPISCGLWSSAKVPSITPRPSAGTAVISRPISPRWRARSRAGASGSCRSRISRST